MLDKKQKGYKSACTLYKRKQLRQKKNTKRTASGVKIEAGSITTM
jgi:hypothetical protein